MAGDIDGVQVVLVDQPLEVDVGEALAGIRAPVPEQPLLRVLQFLGSRSKGLSLRYSIPRQR
jgi:hypothetical protein